jgi:hypothetical protein
MSNRLLCCLAACALALMSAATHAQAADDRAGFIKTVSGDVHVQSDGATRQAKPGDAVQATDRITTGKNSAAGLVLRDGTVLVAGPDSQLDLKDFRFDATTHDGGMLVSLLRGSLRMISGLIGKTHPEAVKVDTPTATIGIRGTDFIVNATP